MYTAIKLGDSKDLQKNTRTVTVMFSNGVSEFNEDFTAPITTDIIDIKKRIQFKLDRINTATTDIPDGVLDFSDIPTKPVDEIAKQEWNEDLEKLRQAKELVDLGVIPADQTKYLALVNKVKLGLKPNYIG